MHIPPAYQAPGRLNVNVGGVDPAVYRTVPAAKFDSWLTIGITDGSKGLASAGLNGAWVGWSETKGIDSSNAGIFWMAPKKSTATAENGPITIGQLTLKRDFAGIVKMTVVGKTNSKGKNNFRVEGVTWHIGKGSSSGTSTSGDCNGVKQFSQRARQVQVACCSADAQCLAGLPTKCVPRCGPAVRTFLDACASLLSKADSKTQTTLQVVQYLCSVGGGGGGH